jgi:glycosyltransferase involved in cell wall biosynthesis
MRIIDIFVLPSLNEGMGRVLIEAMAAGKPIVASNVGGIPDLVKSGKNGLLVPAADSEALAKGIEFFIARPEEREKMGNAGRKIAAGYGSDSMVQMIDRLYDELLSSKTSFETGQ